MVEWFNKQPGQEMLQGRDDPTMLLVGVDKPDWINVPPETGYGGQYACLEIIVAPCPLHGEPCRHYILDGPVHCAECVSTGQFLWYKRKDSHGSESET